MILLDKMSYDPELDRRVRNKIRNNLNLSVDATKFDKEKGRDIKIFNLADNFYLF